MSTGRRSASMMARAKSPSYCSHLMPGNEDEAASMLAAYLEREAGR